MILNNKNTLNYSVSVQNKANATQNLYIDEQNLIKATGNFRMNFVESLARKKRDLLWTNFLFNTKNPLLQKLFKVIDRQNDLLYFFKSNEIQLTKYGACFIKFDFTQFNGQPAIFLSTALPSNFNIVMKLNRNFKTEYFGMGLFEVTASPQGSGICSIQAFTSQDMVNIPWLNNAVGEYMYSDFFTFQTPNYVKQFTTTFKKEVNYGALPMTMLVNMELEDDYIMQPNAFGISNVMDYSNQNGGVNFDKLTNDGWVYYQRYTDWWPVRQLEQIYNYIPEYITWEMLLNQTRVVGNIDVESMRQKLTSPELMTLISKLLLKTNYANGDNKLEILQAQLNGQGHVLFLNSLNEFMLKLCGYGNTNPIQQNGSNETEAKTKQLDNELATTIRHFKTLRENQYKRFFDRIITALYPDKPELLEEYEFVIQSNTLQDTLNDIDRYAKMRDYGLIDKDTAINDLNKDKSPIMLQTIKDNLAKENMEELNKLVSLDNGTSE